MSDRAGTQHTRTRGDRVAGKMALVSGGAEAVDLANDEARCVTGTPLPIDAGVRAISPHFATSAQRLD
ncbi:MAG: hypothetical protein EXR01_07690 [Acetobacteraceae bacterium]|nr:hypothetical protein [Acetobacteraceae bacterium]